MAAVTFMLIFLFFAPLSLYDYSRFVKKGSTGRLSLVIRGVLFVALSAFANREINNWIVSGGYVFFSMWWVWNTYTGLLWAYNSPFATGNTKWIDKLLKFMPDMLLWFLQWFFAMCFLTYHLNGY